ncbi:hypothetical protein EJ08DRAFT_666830 [Tothia fuscella]|uniref:Uncharacterized protein n=1 Tax=Tothia fuscella TaxID=1048955 RepID=A0A9P4TRU3_9PEZI|nr:hypothetical protein EJ08DRAFT_666830 [Tothia fuscella]
MANQDNGNIPNIPIPPPARLPSFDLTVPLADTINNPSDEILARYPKQTMTIHYPSIPPSPPTPRLPMQPVTEEVEPNESDLESVHPDLSAPEPVDDDDVPSRGFAGPSRAGRYTYISRANFEANGAIDEAVTTAAERREEIARFDDGRTFSESGGEEVEEEEEEAGEDEGQDGDDEKENEGSQDEDDEEMEDVEEDDEEMADVEEEAEDEAEGGDEGDAAREDSREPTSGDTEENSDNREEFQRRRDAAAQQAVSQQAVSSSHSESESNGVAWAPVVPPPPALPVPAPAAPQFPGHYPVGDPTLAPENYKKTRISHPGLIRLMETVRAHNPMGGNGVVLIIRARKGPNKEECEAWDAANPGNEVWRYWDGNMH